VDVKPFRWNPQKNETLKADRGVCFESMPFVEEDDHFFLKTVIPSRKATRDYLKQG